jgi:DNA-binding IclR family transcriptional regulator
LEPFPDEVARFIEANIDSVDQLAILRLLAEDPAGEWPIPALARAVQAPPQAVVAQAEALERRGLLSASRGPETCYRYGPHTPELQDGLKRLLRLYNERPVTMIRMVSARAQIALKDFADAFRLRKDG